MVDHWIQSIKIVSVTQGLIITPNIVKAQDSLVIIINHLEKDETLYTFLEANLKVKMSRKPDVTVVNGMLVLDKAKPFRTYNSRFRSRL